MANPTRGLPSSFSLSTSRADLDAPVDLGDFLEEDLARPASRPPAQPAPKAEEPAPPEQVVTLVPERPVERTSAAPRPAAPTPAAVVVPAPATLPEQPQHVRLAKPGPDRLQVNLSPEGRAAYEAVMAHMRRYCPREPNTKHSEVFQSLMMALQDALPHYDLSMVPKRGAWGSATHRSFVVALKGAALKALGKHYQEEYPSS